MSPAGGALNSLVRPHVQPRPTLLPEIHIPVVVNVDLAPGWGGERWNVTSVVDGRTGESLVDIGVDEFDAYSGFLDLLMKRVVYALIEAGELRENAFYDISLDVVDGGSSLGTASRWFRGPVPPKGT